MQLCSSSNMEEILLDETILALRHHGQSRQIDPVAALRQAKEIFNPVGALIPPVNAMFRIIWLPEGEHWYNYQAYICFDYSIPDPLLNYILWYQTWLMEDLELSEGWFIETEPTIVKLWTVNFKFSLLCVFFLSFFDFVFLFLYIN